MTIKGNYFTWMDYFSDMYIYILNNAFHIFTNQFKILFYGKIKKITFGYFHLKVILKDFERFITCLNLWLTFYVLNINLN